MALRVVGNMDEKAAEGRREMSFPYGARLLEIGGSEGANASGSIVQGCIEFVEKNFASEIGIGFAAQDCELRF